MFRLGSGGTGSGEGEGLADVGLRLGSGGRALVDDVGDRICGSGDAELVERLVRWRGGGGGNPGRVDRGGGGGGGGGRDDEESDVDAVLSRVEDLVNAGEEGGLLGGTIGGLSAGGASPSISEIVEGDSDLLSAAGD